jgi:hypothetical protein
MIIMTAAIALMTLALPLPLLLLLLLFTYFLWRDTQATKARAASEQPGSAYAAAIQYH